jgi:RimJ/RimL family protein N-acetyltransferase
MVTLRLATTEDEGRLLCWRNEPVTRAASFSTGAITPREHHLWLTNKLADPSCAIMIVEEDGRPVGQVRLQRLAPEVAEVSIGLAPENRGRGIGREALRLSAGAATSILGVTTLRAFVRAENDVSVNAFRAAGFQLRRRHSHSVELERPARA